MPVLTNLVAVWGSQESLIERKFSAKSDVSVVVFLDPAALASNPVTPPGVLQVWAYGVTLWESVARQDPYPDLDNVAAAQQVMTQGLRLQPPDETPPMLEEIMALCWEEQPSKRPSFKVILSMLGELQGEMGENPFY
jgi:sterile alpha motif and leucine zipper containing kinase AZK